MKEELERIIKGWNEVYSKAISKGDIQTQSVASININNLTTRLKSL